MRIPKIVFLIAVFITINMAENYRAMGEMFEVSQPVLKWQYGGCYSSWCETGWYSSPAIADVNGDGVGDVIGSAYSIVALEGSTGELLWRTKSGHDRSENQGDVDNVGRTWAGIVLADVDHDGENEIVTAHSSGYVAVYNLDGYFEAGWPKHLADNEFRSLAVDDLDGDGLMEIVVGLARLNRINAWALNSVGELRAGWPQLNSEEGSAAGLYNDNIAIGDVDGDGDKELVIPSDTITIGAYQHTGEQLDTNQIFHGHSGHDMDKWGEVPAYIETEYEERGWGPCYQESTCRANFAKGPANIVDVNGDGVAEIVVMGNVHDCHTSPYTDVYITPFIFNKDRTRFVNGVYDWTKPPLNTGFPLIENYHVIESVQPNPVTVDLDGDGMLEILFPSYDGKMHAMWLDKTEHGNWPYAVNDPKEGFYRFASEPIVVDLNSDGHPEVIFASWTQKGSGKSGYLHVLDYLGNSLYNVPLPMPKGSWDWNGALAAPTIGNIDNDEDLEIVLNTAHSGFVAFDLPQSAGANVYWGTGRGSYQRYGSPINGSLRFSQKSVNDVVPGPGDVLTYQITLKNTVGVFEDVVITDTLPVGLAFWGNLTATSGLVSESQGIIVWQGDVSANSPVKIQFNAKVSDTISSPTVIDNEVYIDGGDDVLITRSARIIVNGFARFFPLVSKGR